MDFSLARTNMVKSQVVPNGVTNASLLGALMEIPREAYVANTHQEFAYSDACLPMNATRHSLKPLQIAQLIQALSVSSGQKILLAGAGTGYEATLLTRLGAEVFAVESDNTLADQGKKLTKSSAVQWHIGDPGRGWQEHMPFDAVLLLGSVTSIPDELLKQVSDDGVLVAIVGTEGDKKQNSHIMHAIRIRGQNVQQAETLFETFAFSMSTIETPQPFVL